MQSDSDLKSNNNLHEHLEKEWLSLARDGDQRAFHAIFNQFYPRVYRVAYGIVGQVPWIEDVVQDVFIRLHKSLSRYDMQRKFFTYLYRITVNVCFDYLKKEYPRRSDSIDDNFILNQLKSEENPVNMIEMSDMKLKVNKLIQQLGEQQRAAFILRDIEGLSSDEVAKILKCRKTTVRSHLFHARKALRLMIQKEYPEFCEA